MANRAIKRTPVRVFLLSEKAGSRSFRATVHNPPAGYDSLAVKRGEQAPPKRLEFHWKMGSRTPGDIVLTDDAELLVTARFLKSIKELPGWSSIAVSLMLATGEPAGEFHCLVISGRTGSFLQSRTTKVPAGADKAFDTYKGLCFSVSETFGIGMPSQHLNFVYVSEAFASATRQYCSGSVAFTPCDEVITTPWTYLKVVEKTTYRRS